MKKHILVCGLNGSGKSTFAKALAGKLDAVYKDIEDYYFPDRRAEDAYAEPRSREEVSQRLLSDLQSSDRIVLAAVKANYSEDIEKSFSAAICMETPKAVRLTRIRERSFKKFGERMLKGGDLYESEEAFFRMAQARSESLVEDWLSRLDIPVIRIDGTLPIDENVDRVISVLDQAGWNSP